MAEQAPAWARGMVAALSSGDHRYVLRTAELATEAAQDQPALLARVHTWIAQAWAEDGDLDRARDHIRLAIRAVKEAGDDQGLRQIRGLRRQLLARAKLAPAAVSAAPADAPPTLPAPPDDSATGRALKALAAGDHDSALRHAIEAREQARLGADPKGEVLALLAMARVPGHADGALRAARDVADHAGDKNLVAAVARAGRELGVDLGVKVF